MICDVTVKHSATMEVKTIVRCIKTKPSGIKQVVAEYDMPEIMTVDEENDFIASKLYQSGADIAVVETVFKLFKPNNKMVDEGYAE